MADAPDTYDDIRDAVAKLCEQFPGEYWRKLDRDMAYPTDFVNALTEAGWLAALIPEEFGGAGLPLSAGAAILEEIQKSGGNAGACVTLRCIRWERCSGTAQKHRNSSIFQK